MLPNYDKLVTGNIISYLLPPSELPTNPHRVWHGKILISLLHGNVDIDMLKVESCEPGYEGLSEWVSLRHVTHVKQAVEHEGMHS